MESNIKVDTRRDGTYYSRVNTPFFMIISYFSVVSGIVFIVFIILLVTFLFLCPSPFLWSESLSSFFLAHPGLLLVDLLLIVYVK